MGTVSTAFNLIVTVIAILNDVTAQDVKPEHLADIYKEALLVPQMIPYAPDNILTVKFKKGEAKYGNNLPYWFTLLQPEVSFNDSNDDESHETPGGYYTLLFFSVDSGNPEHLYWMVNNIKGTGVLKGGDYTFRYIDPDPNPFTQDVLSYRMLFLVYKQPSNKPIKFTMKKILWPDRTRDEFDLSDFLTTYNFSDIPVAGNFYNTYSRQRFDYPPYVLPWMKPFYDKKVKEDMDMMAEIARKEDEELKRIQKGSKEQAGRPKKKHSSRRVRAHSKKFGATMDV